MRYLYITAVLLLLFGCDNDSDKKSKIRTDNEEQVKAKSGFTSLDPELCGISFQNFIEENEEHNHLVWDAVYYGGGVGIGDFNNDGLEDIYFTGNQVSDAIYINKGNFKFEDITTTSGISQYNGWSNGVSVVDINLDGFLDIYVCKSGWLSDNEMVDDRRNKLFINNGDLTFTDAAAEYGLDNEGYSTQATWLDYDKDGDLDMFLLNAPSNNISQKVNYNQIGFPDFASDKLFRNDGDNNFVEVSEETGVKAFSFGLGVVAKDFNHDGWIDIYVANDYERPDYMYMNLGNGTFENQLNSKVKHTCFTAMGVDGGDINNDCLVDFAVLDMQSEDHYRSKTNMPTMKVETFWSWVDKGYNYQYMTNVLQMNNGAGYFSDISQIAGVASTDWSWSVLLEDFNDDSYKDIYVTNGINRDIRNNDFALKFEKKMEEGERIDLFELAKETPSTLLPNYLFENSGDLEFKNVTSDSGVGQPSFSYGAATADLDGDGDMDLIVNNNNASPFIYQNNSNSNWLNIKIDGDQKNKKGLGTKAVIFYGDQKQYKELTDVRGYQSSSECIMHFGLGNENKVDSILVLFPDNKSVKRKNVNANQLLTINRIESKNNGFDVYGPIKPFIIESTSNLGIDFTHRENQFDDYENETLLPHRQSTAGPFLSKADVNSDGLLDFFIGGAANQAGMLYIQNSKGGFTSSESPFSIDKIREDMGSAFFDFDSDGDLDLYVVSGGGHLPINDPNYKDRLYLNDGNGNFSKHKDFDLMLNGSCVKSCDYDQDGDVDLFVGGRGIPGKYPRHEESIILQNNNGQFMPLDNPDIKEYCGLVTDAEWFDMDGDNDQDLIVVGEWMAPVVYVNTGGTLIYDDSQNAFSELSGWWYSVNAEDVNDDGQMDLILGNVGVNNKFHVSPEKPLRVYENDLDGNETNDIILAKLSNGRYVPARGRECSSEQVPAVSENFQDFESFATASIEEVYGEELNEALMLEVKNFKSGILINNGGQFSFNAFPNGAQISPVMGTVFDDFDKDGIKDILITGNMFEAEVETTRHDSGNGLLLKGKGNLEFEPIFGLFTGFYTPENSKSIIDLPFGKSGKKLILVGINNNRLKAFLY